MAEVEELCERLAIVDRGRIIAIGSPAELRHKVQSESIFLLELDRLDAGVQALARVPGVVKALAATDADSGPADRQTVMVKLVLTDDAALGGVVSALDPLGAHIVALRKSEPSLEDVFVELVGRGFDDNGNGNGDDGRNGNDSNRDGGGSHDSAESAARPPENPEPGDSGEPTILEEEPRQPVGTVR